MDCNSCRNALHWAFKGYDKKTIITKIQTSASFKAAYILLVYAWEEREVGPEGARLTTQLPGVVAAMWCEVEDNVESAGTNDARHFLAT